MMKLLLLLGMCLVSVGCVDPLRSAIYDENFYISPEGMPRMGKWMINGENRIADWLGIKVNGKSLIEPINIIIIDERSETPEQAAALLNESCKNSGFPSRIGHSFGYQGSIGGKLLKQYPQEMAHAYSDGDANKTNHHGRIFGPYYDEQAKRYYFTGAFSTEDFNFVYFPILHAYKSFQAAKTAFASKMDGVAIYKIAGEVDLYNDLNSQLFSTGDHDGKAIVLFAAAEKVEPLPSSPDLLAMSESDVSTSIASEVINNPQSEGQTSSSDEVR